MTEQKQLAVISDIHTRRVFRDAWKALTNEKIAEKHGISVSHVQSIERKFRG